MNVLKQKVIEKIEKEGPITFETFMEMALYEPGIGYYASERTEIGKEGDFYTSPHLHPAFGAMVGKQIEEMWEIMQKPGDFHILEIGGGAGYLCKDILDYLVKRSSVPAAE
jgi:SAM-dependent MidA family methyltransferase